jgi:hypothetical protein
LKTAAQNANTEFGWTITKAVDKTEIDPVPGGTATFHYTVTLTGTPETPTIGDVTGTITVVNNAVDDITLTSLTDQLSDGTTTCTVDTSGDPSLLIPGLGTQDFPYSCGLSAYPSDYPNTMNTASMTWDAQGPFSDGSTLAAGQDSKTVPVDFTTSVTDNCATATDTFDKALIPDPLGTYCADDGSADLTGVTLTNFKESYTTPPPTWTLEYDRTVNAPALGTCVNHDNTAAFADNSEPQNKGHADKTVTVCTFNAPLTIGYWWNHLANSNHSGSFIDSNCAHLVTGTCSKNGPWTKQFLPQPLGGAYSVDTILKAASVFAANNCSSSGSQNAIGCLAAQLLGAELNRANISNSCIDPVIATANTFLTNPPVTSVTYGGFTANSINYVGPTGNYSGISSTQRSLALALKNTLVNYNQGGGC